MAAKKVIVMAGGRRLSDVEIPLDISADQLIRALHASFFPHTPLPSYIRSDNPVAFLRGAVPVESFGLRDGSILYIE